MYDIRLLLGDSLVSAFFPQLIKGAKTFQDKAGFLAGLDANGVTSTGSSTAASMTLNGVQSVKDTLVSNDFTLNGLVSSVGFTCPTKDNICYLPTLTGSKGWIYSIRKRDNTPFKVIVRKPDNTEFFIYNIRVVTYKNNGTEWERINF